MPSSCRTTRTLIQTIPGYQSRGQSGANPFADVVALLHLLRRSSPAALSSTTRRRRRAFILCQSRRRGQAAAEYMESGICSCFRGLDHPALLSAFLLCNGLVVVPSMHRSRNLSRGRPSRWSFRFLMSCPRASHGTTPFLSADCYRGDQELTYDGRCQVTGGIVALGKFDALHIGHRELAIQAAKAGVPCLLSFVGMAEVLGWECRAPIVAKCDRQRVLSTWASFCGDTIPLEFSVKFSGVRHLSPQQFVEKLAKELGVSGIVAGENYRFGYRASGDVSELVKLCEEYGLSVSIVKPVMDKRQAYVHRSSEPENGRERGQVSSTRVRHALAAGDVLYVTELLGRPHRLVLAMGQSWTISGTRLLLPKAAALNQPPKEGLYQQCTLLVDDSSLEPCQVIIGTTSVEVALLDAAAPDTWNVFRQCQHLGIEFDGAR